MEHFINLHVTVFYDNFPDKPDITATGISKSNEGKKEKNDIRNKWSKAVGEQ